MATPPAADPSRAPDARRPDPDGSADGPVFYALIGDVVGSRDVDDRAELQRSLRDGLAELNRRHRSGLVAALELTAGDEVQGLAGSPELAVHAAVALADRLHPVEMRWGMGAGGLSTDPGGGVATLDGPCFHRARRAAREAADAGAWLRLEGFPPPHGEAAEALFSLLGAVRSRWTETQARYIREARGRLQKEVAEAFDVHKSTVSKALGAARWDEVREGEAAARSLLRWLGERLGSGAGGGGAGGSGDAGADGAPDGGIGEDEG